MARWGVVVAFGRRESFGQSVSWKPARKSRRFAAAATPLLLVAWLITISPSAEACNIPVFRYALERWRPDACEIVIFHDGEMSESQRQWVEQLESSTAEKGGFANARVTRCATGSTLDPKYQLLFDSLRKRGTVALPHVVVRTIIAGDQPINHWHGSLDDAVDANLLQSPVRKELSRRLLAGHSVVWLLLKSADDKRTSEARELLETNFKTLDRKISLPEGIGLPGSELHSEVPLLLKFSTLEIDPNDEQERILINLLTGFRPEAVAEGEPLLVPVFGRGRALEVIPAGQVDSRLIEDLTLFLSGACSCQVKNQNPGFDLLLSADWDTELFGQDGVRPPPPKTSGDRLKSPVLLTIPPGRSK